jgi:hypothetical protein
VISYAAAPKNADIEWYFGNLEQTAEQTVRVWAKIIEPKRTVESVPTREDRYGTKEKKGDGV